MNCQNHALLALPASFRQTPSMETPILPNTPSLTPLEGEKQFPIIKRFRIEACGHQLWLAMNPRSDTLRLRRWLQVARSGRSGKDWQPEGKS